MSGLPSQDALLSRILRRERIHLQWRYQFFNTPEGEGYVYLLHASQALGRIFFLFFPLDFFEFF